MTHSPRPVTYDTSETMVPPAHSICDGMVPIVAGTAPSTPEPRHIDSAYTTPVSNDEGSKLALEAPTEPPVTQTGEDSNVDHDVRGPDLSEEPRLVQEGNLLVVENPRFHHHQVPPAISGPSGVELLMTEGTAEMPGPGPAGPGPIACSVVDEPPRQGVSVVREIRQDIEPPNEPLPSVHLSVPAGEPLTPKKSTKNTSSPSPQKSGFLDSLKKVFNGSGHRESSSTPREKTRDKEREKKRERAREREERLREQEERREEHQRERQAKAKEKKNQKLAREHDREMRLLAPSSSSDDEPVVDDNSLRRYRKKQEEGEEEEAPTSKFAGIGKGKKKEKKKLKAEKEGMSFSASESRKDRDSDEPSWTADGFLMRKNTELEKNLKGGILQAKRSGEHHAHEPLSSRRSSVAATMATEDRRRVGGDVSVQRSAFIVERGAKYTQTPSVCISPFLLQSSPAAGIPSSSVPRAPLPRLNDTRFREELNSQNGTMSPKRPAPLMDSGKRNGGYASDTPLAAAPGVAFPAVGVTAGRPTVARKSSKKRTVVPSTVGGEGGKPISVLSKATAPAGMSTGLGDRRGSVGASVLTPRTGMMGGTHRRAVSVDYGQPGRGSGPVVSRGPERGGGSLMSIVDDVTRSNRRAWDVGVVERGRGARFEDDAQARCRLLPESVSSGVVGRDGLAPDIDARRMGLGGQVLPHGGGGSGTAVWAPAKVDRQLLMVSSPGKAPSSAAHAEGARPLKSALRMNQSPLPSPGGAMGLSRLPPPVGRVRSDEDRDSASTSSSSSSSYETGHEDFDDDVDEVVPRRRKSHARMRVQTPTQKSSGFRRKEQVEEGGGVVRRPGYGSPPLVASGVVVANSPGARARSSGGGSGAPLVKRKSVRVSLNPTFSPGPVVVEDDVGRGHGHEVEVKKSTATWDDDSDDGDDNAAYQQAKLSLLKATRKEKQVFGVGR